jgi:hypothetical protein
MVFSIYLVAHTQRERYCVCVYRSHTHTCISSRIISRSLPRKFWKVSSLLHVS